MNNRQKAKHFKKLYEAIRCKVSAPIFPTTKRNIVRINAKQTISESVINELSDKAEPDRVIAERLLLKELAREVSQYCKCTIEPSEIPYHVNLIAELDIVQQDKGEP